MIRLVQWWPIIVAEIYLVGTFLLLWVNPISVQIENKLELVIYVASAYGLLFLGYYNYTRGRKKWLRRSPRATSVSSRGLNGLLVASSIHWLVFSVACLYEYNCLSPEAILAAVSNPGEAYAAKFDVYDLQIHTGRVSLPLQLCTLTYVLHYVLPTCTIVFWSQLKRSTKCIIGLAVLFHSCYFVAIGTQVGLYNTLLLFLLGYLLRLAGLSDTHPGVLRIRLRRFLLFTIVLVFVSAALLGVVQMSRAETFNIESKQRFQIDNTVLEKLLGNDAAVFVYRIIFYPTHGYVGLAFSLQQEFVPCWGQGFSRATSDYMEQYLGIPHNFDRTYLARTEARTGWPALMYWSTIFPWLASDITFPLAAVAMYFVGWLLAWSWEHASRHKEVLAIIVLAEMVILTAYIPANNQIFQSRTNLWGVIGTVIIGFTWRYLRRRRPIAPSVRYTCGGRFRL